MGDPWGGAGPPKGDHIVLRLLRNYGYEVDADDMKWILVGENHLKTFPDYPQGMFTIRIESFNKEPTIWQSLEEGKTHGVFLFSYEKRESEAMELLIDAWLVDLFMCAKMLHTSVEKRRNRQDSNQYLIFDPTASEMQLFCHRIFIPSKRS